MLQTNNQEKINRLKQLLKDVSSPQTQPRSTQQPNYSFNQSQTQIKKKSSYNVLLPFEQQALQLEEKLSNRLQQDWRLLENISYDVQETMEAVRGLKKDLQKSKDMNERKASKLQSQFSEDVNEQIEQIRGLKKQLNESIEHKYKTIKTETMAVLGNQFENGTDIARQQISNQIGQIKASMDRQQSLRDQLVTQMVNRMGDEIIKLQHCVQRQKQQRIDSHKKLMNSIFTIQEQIQTNILLQRRDAMNSHSGLQVCLQQLCYKIENQILR